MDFWLDKLKGVKRMRLNNGDMVNSSGLDVEDECRLRLGSCLTPRMGLTSGVDDDFRLSRTVTVDHDISLSGAFAVNHNISLGRSTSTAFCTSDSDHDLCPRGGGNRTRSFVPSEHITSGICHSFTGFSNRSITLDNWTSEDSFRKIDSQHEVLAEVALGLELKIAPGISITDSALTSVHHPSSNDMETSGAQLPYPAASFLHQDSSQISDDIPMIDEGSTSNGKYILPFLKNHHFGSLQPLDAQRFESHIHVVPEIATETDISMSFRASSGTTSTSGASSVGAERGPKMCRFTGCIKRARGASGLCISHGGGKRCQRQGCNKGAEGSTIFCKAHGGGRRCESLGCTKSSEGKTNFCIAHGGGVRCVHDGCSKAARGRTGFCIKHGGGKRCQKEGCTKSAEGYTTLCIAHGGGKRCQYPDCGKGAQGSTKFCKAHGGGKRCIVEGCNKGAEGSTPLCKGHGGGKRCMFDGGGICTKSVHGGTLYCVAHGGGKRCVVQGCTKSARGRTDCCVKHGGGKRCKFENCSKSAQGSTDFCKAHGGGKRCMWGQEGSVHSGEVFLFKERDLFKGSCDRYAKGKLGLCAAHSALVQDQRVHGTVTFGSSLSSGVAAGSLQGGMVEKNLLLSFNASEDLEDGTDSQADSPLQASGSSGQEQERMQEDACYHPQPHLFPSVLAIGASRTSDFSMHFSTRDGVSAPASMVPPAISSSMFGPPSLQRRVGERRENSGRKDTSNMDDDGIFNMSSLSLPEERVHGGNIMALLSGGSLK